MNLIVAWWVNGWRMWRPDLEWYAQNERLEKDLRAASLAAGDPDNMVADWIRQMREEARSRDDDMVRLCKHQRVLMVAWVVVMVMLIGMPLWMRLLRR